MPIDLGEAIQLPTLALPPTQLYQTPSLDQPVADIPSYKPLVVPPSDLRKPKETKSKTTEKTEQPPPTPKIDIPYFNFEVPLPTTEVVMAATYAAVSAVAVTTFAQPFFNTIKKKLQKSIQGKVDKWKQKPPKKKDSLPN
jgi:hypothetical protein